MRTHPSAVDVRLYALFDVDTFGGGDAVAAIRAAVDGGATLLQLRWKTGDDAAFADLARRTVEALAGSPVPVLINDRVDVARASGAHGVHLGQEDMAVAEARDRLGPKAIIGLTIKTDVHVAAAPVDLIDYAAIGGVFATTTKVNPDPPVGLDGLRRLSAALRARRADLPVCAIAGITVETADGVVAAGGDGVCVVSAIFGAEDPEDAARALRAIVDRVGVDHAPALVDHRP